MAAESYLEKLLLWGWLWPQSLSIMICLSLDSWRWVLTMVVTCRLRSFFLEPPCTTFSPAAYPSCRSYAQPLGYDRKDGKTFHGNLLAFRSFIVLRVGRKRRTPSGLEQPRRSKMCWTPMWKSLLEKGFSEAVIASCQFGSRNSGY